MPDRCAKCILPSNYLGLTFNAGGICSHCQNFVPHTYLGIDALKNDIQEILHRFPDRTYDCILGISGGRDSTYLLHILKNVLNLNPLTYFIDHDYIPEHTRKNVHTIAEKAGVKLVVEKSKILGRCFPKEYRAWNKRPSASTISALCMGCKGRVVFSDYRLGIKYRVPIIINGGTPFEYASYKSDLMKMRPGTSEMRSYKSGYFHEVMKNPSLISDPYLFFMQAFEYFTYMPFNPLTNKALRNIFHFTFIEPYWKYIRWEEKEVIETIQKEFDWKNFPGMQSTWRGDCHIGPVRQFLYYALLGYSDKDVHLSALIRDGQVSREEAMRRITEENKSSRDILAVCCRKAGVDYDDLMETVKKHGQVRFE
jgi:glucosamine--fructose-6-phosphate aminotransferase (isomerizing)